MASARPRATRWACPPERAPGRWPAWSARPRRSSHSAARARASALGTPRARSPKATFSSALRLAKSRWSWNTTPTERCSGVTNTSAAGSSTTVPPISMRPSSMGSSPARQRISVVLPAPLGPSTATTSPGSTASATRRSSGPRATPTSALQAHALTAPGSPPSHRSRRADEHAERHDDEHEREHDGLAGVALEGQVDGQRHGLGLAREVAGEGDGGAELAEGPGPRQHRAGDEGGPDGGQGHPSEGVPAAGAEGAGGVLGAAVEAPQAGLDAEHQERHRHERLGHHHAEGGEGEADAEPVVERPADHARGGRRRRTGRRRRRPAAAPSTARTAPARSCGRGSRRGRAPRPAARRARSRSPSPTASRSARAAARRSTTGAVSSSHASPHGTRHSRPRNGQGEEEHRQRRPGRGTATGVGRPRRRGGRGAAEPSGAVGSRGPEAVRGQDRLALAHR